MENKHFESMNELLDKIEETKAKYDGGEQERKFMTMRFESSQHETRHMKEELFNLKDDLRRQIEDSHLDLKKTFAEFTSQIDSFSQTVELERAAV